MTFIHVHHVKYTVSGLDRSVKFYLLDPDNIPIEIRQSVDP
jgi:hypothetical protein